MRSASSWLLSPYISCLFLMSVLRCQWNLAKLSVEDHGGPVLGMVWHGDKEHGLWNKVDLYSDLFSAVIFCDLG